MKKKLVAVAVAGVLGAPLAAHAQSANVTLYGRLNLDLEFVHGEQPAVRTRGSQGLARIRHVSAFAAANRWAAV